MAKSDTIIINLGLGCLSVIKDDEVRLVYDNKGRNTTPSAITFKGNRDLFGGLSEQDLSKNTKNTISWSNLLNSLTLNSDTKKFIKNHSLFEFTDIEIHSDIKDIKIEIKCTNKIYHPEILSGTTITYIKQTAEKYLAGEVKYAVITVPVYFSNWQCLAIKLAAEKAGLEVLKLIIEPSEASMSSDAKKKLILFYDLDQTTFNVSILEASKKNLVVKATENSGNISIAEYNPYPHPQPQYNQNLTDKSTIELVQKCLDHAQLIKSDIDSVIMIGYSSHLPEAHKVLKDFFPDTPILNEMNTDRAVATAAALLAVKKSYAIGIDLGTTKSCVYVIKDGQPKLIKNTDGQISTPSAIAFTKNGVLFGENALRHNNDKNIIKWMKMFMGRKFEDNVVERMKENCCFEIINYNSNIKIVVDVEGECKTFFPEELVAIFISYLRDTAKEFLGEYVNKAVITVPANFNNAQRQATKLAAELAGLEVLNLLNEPTAAAIAYKEMYKTKNQLMLLYNLGGGTFDVSVVEVLEEQMIVKAVAGNTDLGGEKFTEKMVNYCERIKDAINAQRYDSVFDNVKSTTRHREQCEKAKQILSTNKTVQISLEGLHNNDEYRMSLSQDDFNKLNIDLFRSTIDGVQKCLKDSNTNKNDIDNIIMIGGSSQIPEVKRRLQDLFPNTRITKLIKPDELVAMGAALLADQLNKGVKLTNVCNDVTPLSLGIENWKFSPDDLNMLSMIQRNIKIPATVTNQYYHKTNNTNSIKLQLYEDKDTVTSNSRPLGIFEIYVESSPNIDGHINVTCDIDTNGILTVHSNVTNGKNTERLEVDQYWIRSENEINLMIKHVKQYLSRIGYSKVNWRTLGRPHF